MPARRPAPSAAPSRPARLVREAALARVAELFEGSRYAEALEGARALVEEAPREGRAWHYRAEAALALGSLDEARLAFSEAEALLPGDLQVRLGHADLLICSAGDEREGVEAGLERCVSGREEAYAAGDVELALEFSLLEGMAFNQLGAAEAALERLGEVLAAHPEARDAALERAVALHELCRFEEARAAFEAVVELSPEEPWAHHHLGLIAERSGRARDAERSFARARALSDGALSEVSHLSPEEFDAAVVEAAERLPSHVRGLLREVVLAVEPWPSEADLRASRPPLSPSILGIFRGIPLTEQTPDGTRRAATIVLYQRNLERHAGPKESLVEQLAITLMHEAGHLIGLDEEDLWARGLE